MFSKYLSKINLFLFFKLCVCACKCSAWGGLKGAPEAQELESQVVVSHLLWVLCEQSSRPLQEQYTGFFLGGRIVVVLFFQQFNKGVYW